MGVPSMRPVAGEICSMRGAALTVVKSARVRKEVAFIGVISFQEGEEGQGECRLKGTALDFEPDDQCHDDGEEESKDENDFAEVGVIVFTGDEGDDDFGDDSEGEK